MKCCLNSVPTLSHFLQVYKIYMRRGGWSLTRSARTLPARAKKKSKNLRAVSLHFTPVLWPPSDLEVRRRKKEKKERIMPSLVATTSALARTMFVRLRYIRTNLDFRFWSVGGNKPKFDREQDMTWANAIYLSFCKGLLLSDCSLKSLTNFSINKCEFYYVIKKRIYWVTIPQIREGNCT